jgi:hypothetical protein
MRHGASLLLMLAITASMEGKVADDLRSSEQVSTLSGTVTDAKGKGIGQVKAELLDCYTMQVTKLSLADEKGAFILTPDRKLSNYCLQFSKEGFTTLQINIQVTKSASSIRVTLPAGW